MRIKATTLANVPTGSATKTILQVAAAANRQLKLHEVSVSFQGTDSAAEPIEVQILRQTTAGTGGVANNPVKLRASNSGSVESTGLRGPAGAWGAEPTAGDVLHAIMIHPNAGAWHYVIPDPDEYDTADAGRLAVRVVSPAAASACDCVVSMELDE